MTTGSCLCGNIKFEIRGTLGLAYYCYCSRCRKTNGSAFTANAVVLPEQFIITLGETMLKTFTSDAGINRHFCSNCGSSILVSQGDQMRVRLGVLDAPAVTPQMHIFTASKADWVKICDGLPQYDERP